MRSKLDTSMLDVEWWPRHVATAWVLSRNREFTCECALFGDVEDEAGRWRNGGLSDPQWDARRRRRIAWEKNHPKWQKEHERSEPPKLKFEGRPPKPLMLFPSAEAALRHLCNILKVNIAAPCFRRSEVIAHFPPDSEPGYLLEGVWRGDDPRGQARVPFSHAAWWLASDLGTRAFALDDPAAWKRAFHDLLQAIVTKEVSIFQIGEPPVTLLPPHIFDGVPVELPYGPSETYRPGEKAFIACLDPAGDLYFERVSAEPKWRGLTVSSEELIRCFEKQPTYKTACSRDEYRQHWDEVCKTPKIWPSDEEDDNWAKQMGFSVDSVRSERKYHIDNLPAELRDHIRKGGPRRPFPKI